MFSSWTALADGRYLRWSPEEPHLSGDDKLVPVILARLAGSGTVALSPTGPYVVLDPADPHAVLAVLREISVNLLVSKDGPVVQIPPGAVA